MLLLLLLLTRCIIIATAVSCDGGRQVVVAGGRHRLSPLNWCCPSSSLDRFRARPCLLFPPRDRFFFSCCLRSTTPPGKGVPAAGFSFVASASFVSFRFGASRGRGLQGEKGMCPLLLAGKKKKKTAQLWRSRRRPSLLFLFFSSSLIGSEFGLDSRTQRGGFGGQTCSGRPRRDSLRFVWRGIRKGWNRVRLTLRR